MKKHTLFTLLTVVLALVLWNATRSDHKRPPNQSMLEGEALVLVAPNNEPSTSANEIAKSTELMVTTKAVKPSSQPDEFKEPTVYSVGQIYKAGLTPELYDELLEQLRYEKESFLFKNVWVELLGYTDSGEPVFEIFNIMDFSETANDKLNVVFEKRLGDLESSNEHGLFNQQLEYKLSDLLDSEFEGRDFEILTVACRDFYCVTKIAITDRDELDFSVIHNSIMREMEGNNSNPVNCTRSQFLGNEFLYFYYKCAEITSST